MRKIIVLAILTSLLLWCSNEQEVIQEEKTELLIHVQKLDELWNNSDLVKSWKLEWKEDIVIASQAAWRIWKISVKEWDKVKVWQLLIKINDTIANYNLNLKKADNTIEKLKISYDSTKVSLDKQIYDTEIWLEKLKNSLETLKANSQIDISQAKDNLANTNYSWSNSKSSIELEKLENSIDKANFDYENALKTNKESIESNKNLIKKEITNQLNYFTDVINFADKLYNISWLYEDDVKKIQDYLWANDVVLRESTKSQLIELNNIKVWSLQNLDLENMDEKSMLEYLTMIEKNYKLIDTFLSSLKLTLKNSIPSLWSLSQAQIDWYITGINWLQTQLTSYNWAFTQFKNSATTFLNTYKNNEESLAKQLELLNKDKELFLKNYDLWSTQSQNALDKTIISTNDAIKSLELQIKQTEETIKIAKESRELSLKWIENNIQEANLWKEAVLKELSKLTVSSSIDWVVKDVLVDEWEDVANWKPLISITWDNSSSVELNFKENELAYIDVWYEIFTKIWDRNINWKIYSISSISDDSLNYKVLAVFDEKIQNLWWVIDVSIPIKTESILIPIKNIKLIWTNKWIIYTYNNWKIIEKEALFWKMYKDNIEFLSFVDWTKINDVYIILSDVSNYDETKNNLKLEQ